MNNLDFGAVFLMASAATPYTKSLTDLLKRSPIPTVSWSLPFIAIGFGILICFLISMMLGQLAFTQQVIGTNCLAGLSAGFGAVVVTEIQKKSEV